MTDYGEPWALDYTPEDEGGPEAYELRARRLDPIVEGQPPSAFTDTIAIGHADDGWTVAGWEEHKRRMERIVACVNFCRGIPTEMMLGSEPAATGDALTRLP